MPRSNPEYSAGKRKASGRNTSNTSKFSIIAVVILLVSIMIAYNPTAAALNILRTGRVAICRNVKINRFCPSASLPSPAGSPFSKLTTYSTSSQKPTTSGAIMDEAAKVTEEMPKGESQTAEGEAPLGLPEPGSGDDTYKLDMSNGGSTVKLDHLGPLVVNVDGSLSRISNWDQMTEIERKNTLRILGKRNRQRLDAVKAKEEQSGAS